MRLELGNLSVVAHSSNQPSHALNESEIKDFLNKAKPKGEWNASSEDAYSRKVDYKDYSNAKIELHRGTKQDPYFVLHQDSNVESKLKFLDRSLEPSQDVPDLLKTIYNSIKTFFSK